MEKIETPDSSNLEWFGYEMKEAKLYIRFRSGKTFVYDDVPAHAFAEMKEAPSKGSHFAKHIKGKYDAVIEEDVF